MEKLLLLFDSKKAQPISLHIFFFFRVLIFAKYESFAYLTRIYFRECRLKENFACNLFCEIDQNSRNSRRYIHAKISTLKVLARGVRQGMDFWDFLTQKRFL